MKQQINSRMETSKLIGVIEFYCHSEKINFVLQPASQAKPLYSDSFLVKNNILVRNKTYYYALGIMTSRHIRDAIRHSFAFYRIYKKEKLKESKNHV